MHKLKKAWLFLCCFIVLALTASISSVAADEIKKLTGMKFAQLAWGVFYMTIGLLSLG